MRTTTCTTTWSVKLLFPLFGLLLFLSSCQDPQQIGSELLPQAGQISTGFTDTLTVRLSTVQQDSATTANTGLALVGRYVDPDLGPLEARTFLRMAGLDSLDYSVFNRFDSLVFYTRVTYAYGDTTRPQAFSVFRLTQPMAATRRYQASDQIPYEPVSLGTAQVRPRFISPGAVISDSVRIRLPDALGKQILDKAGLSETFKQNFGDWFRGLVLVPDAANTALLGFTAASASETGTAPISTSMVLYYHRQEPGRPVEKFSFGWYSWNIPNQVDGGSFTNLTAKRPGALAELVPGQRILASRTNGRSFVQGSTGLTTLIELPYLEQFRMTPTGVRTVNRVELILEPAPIPGALTPPSSLELIESDARYQYARTETNSLKIILPDLLVLAPNTQGASPAFGYIDGRYVVDITFYVRALLSKSKLNNGMLLRLNTVVASRLGLDASKVKMRVYYTEAPL